MHPGFCRSVITLPELSGLSDDRTDVDDAAITTFAHAIDYLTAKIENTGQVDGNHGIPFVGFHFFQYGITCNSGIVYQYADRAMQ